MSLPFYSLIFVLKLETVKKFKLWVTSIVLPKTRKYMYGQFKLFNNPDNHMFKIENETGLYYKGVSYMRRFILIQSSLWALVKIKIQLTNALTHGKKAIPKANTTLLYKTFKDFIAAFVLNLNCQPIITKLVNLNSE